MCVSPGCSAGLSVGNHKKPLSERIRYAQEGFWLAGNSSLMSEILMLEIGIGIQT